MNKHLRTEIITAISEYWESHPSFRWFVICAVALIVLGIVI